MGLMVQRNRFNRLQGFNIGMPSLSGLPETGTNSEQLGHGFRTTRKFAEIGHLYCLHTGNAKYCPDCFSKWRFNIAAVQEPDAMLVNP